MREILFRGKRLDNDEWVEGFLAQTQGHTYIIQPGWYDDDLFISLYNITDKVDPETVGQYTGLTDKNGKKIFEGDVIKTHYINTKKNDFVEQVVFHNGRFCSMFKFSDNARMWANLPDGVQHLPQDKAPYMDWCEVIGNIHDNPELLEGGAEDGK